MVLMMMMMVVVLLLLLPMTTTTIMMMYLPPSLLTSILSAFRKLRRRAKAQEITKGVRAAHRRRSWRCRAAFRIARLRYLLALFTNRLLLPP
jgi:hypothetical protein